MVVWNVLTSPEVWKSVTALNIEFLFVRLGLSKYNPPHTTPGLLKELVKLSVIITIAPFEITVPETTLKYPPLLTRYCDVTVIVPGVLTIKLLPTPGPNKVGLVESLK